MHMNVVMHKILDEVKEGDDQLIDHATSLLHVLPHMFKVFAFPR
jgi:hypothetical protein